MPNIRVIDEMGNPIQRVSIAYLQLDDGDWVEIEGQQELLTDLRGEAVIDLAISSSIRLSKSGYLPQPRITVTDNPEPIVLHEQLVLRISNEDSEPLTGVEINAYDRSNESIALDGESYTSENGIYTFQIEIDPIGIIELSLNGYIGKSLYLNQLKQVQVILLEDNPSNRNIQRVLGNYEEISRLVTGNSPDNDTVIQNCLLEELPPIDEKIGFRINPES